MEAQVFLAFYDVAHVDHIGDVRCICRACFSCRRKSDHRDSIPIVDRDIHSWFYYQSGSEHCWNFLLSTFGILRAERGEGSTAFMDLVRDGFQHFGRIFSAVLIIQLTIGAIFTVVFLCMTLLSLVTMGLASFCLQPIMLLLTPLSFLTIAVTDGAVIAVIDENLSAWEAVKRAIQVVREHVWKFIILTLIVYLGTTILSSIYCPRYDSRNGGSDHARV